MIRYATTADERDGRFMDSAAVIKNLNLVITIDTSIGHLAAALGIPTWILLPEPADWRWMRSRTDTPWYPNVRLFRQQTPGDWSSVMHVVATALKEYVSIVPREEPGK
jgi:ADP-heptose:LPS heptosyltransferase